MERSGKTYIQELQEKESSYGKVFKVSGPCKSYNMQWLLPKEWQVLKCTNSSESAMTSWSEKLSSLMPTLLSYNATKIPVFTSLFSWTYCW